jgi:NADPH-dependent glutamate synthase beta subunit-like oxidoreductase
LAIKTSQLQPQFKFQVASMPGGEFVKRCYDCGSCAGICPVSQNYPVFDPRKILHMINMGLKDRLLNSEAIWYCSHCDSCKFVCPQEVQFSSVVDVLREMAVKEGYADSKNLRAWGTAPCKAECPAHISIPGFVNAITQGRYSDGLKLIKEEMPFPGVCGRICPHPCEVQCNRASIDRPIAIEALKRFLADMDRSSNISYIPKKKPSKEEKVAVIGSGPAGLTVSYYLAIEGYPVTVFEKHPVAGGMMAVGIPEFRLPRNILKAEIEIIKKLGVEIKLNFEVGKDCSFGELQNNYKAIFIGVGCSRSLKLGVPGENELSGIIDGLTFLKNINLENLPTFKGKIVVIGGGNTAVDCARTAKRLGYNRVSILYRRTREEMPADPWEVDETIEEEIDIQFLTMPVKIMAENGKVSGVECIRMQLGNPDKSGRRRPIPIKGSEFKVEADVVVSAIGQAPDLRCLPEKACLNITKQGLIQADPLTAMTKIPGIFSGGDVVSGPGTVVEAVAFGKIAAISIDRYLQGKDIIKERKRDWKGINFAFEGLEFEERERMPELSLPERKRTFKEIKLGYREDQAKKEADRCLRVCGLQKPD